MENIRFHVNLRKVLISESFLEVSPELLKMSRLETFKGPLFKYKSHSARMNV